MRRIGGFGTLLGVLIGTGVLVGAVTVGCSALLAESVPAAHAATADVRAMSAAVGPDFGNPNGHVYVPPAGRVVNTGHPTT